MLALCRIWFHAGRCRLRSALGLLALTGCAGRHSGTAKRQAGLFPGSSRGPYQRTDSVCCACG